MPPRSLRTPFSASLCAGHPKPNFCADEKVDLGLVELLSLNISAHQALSYPSLLLKSCQECGFGGGYLHLLILQCADMEYYMNFSGSCLHF